MKSERMIPNVYEQSFDMRTMCRFFDIEHELLEYYTNHILDCYSPEHCPRALLPELAEHIGFDYQELKSVMYNRVVLKNFIKNMIRYRGSATGIGNAAAIDIRYRQTYPEGYYRYTPGGVEYVEDTSGDVGKQIPMNFHESIDISKIWLDVDSDAAIIYLFIIASDYFPKITVDMDDVTKQKNFEERMRRLLDLAYLQEYVRPVGMYLLPMVAQKANPYTDLTVKAVVIPEVERKFNNGVTGIPNSSMTHDYDRMLFARVENPDDDLSVEPWVRTLYHSQIAGKLQHEYYTKPVYHIEGKFLYYDHDELLSIYSEIQQNVPGMQGMKIGDSLYNPNIVRPEGSYSYGPEHSDEAEPLSLQQRDVARQTYDDLLYPDHVGFPKPRTYQSEYTIAKPIITDALEPYPIYLDTFHVPEYRERLLETLDTEFMETEDGILLAVPEQVYKFSMLQTRDLKYLSTTNDIMLAVRSNYLINAYVGTHYKPSIDTPGDGDDGTNKNLMINLFQVDEHDESKWTGACDVQIAGKGPVPRQPVPYDPATNGSPTGSDAYWSVKNSEGEDKPGDIIP